MSFKKTQALRSRRHGTISLNEDHIEGEEVIQSKAYQAWSLMSLKASWTLALRFPTPRQISGSCLLSPKLENSDADGKSGYEGLCLVVGLACGLYCLVKILWLDHGLFFLLI